MNFLAHAYLSFQHPGALAGNMISDFVKGRKKFDFPLDVQKGIALHREIDAYTDAHLITKAAASFFREEYRLYAPAFIDIVYDHFLANDEGIFPNAEALIEFSGKTYLQLESSLELFPDPFREMFPYMKEQNWLYNYRFEDGIANSFAGLVRRAAYLTDPAPAMLLFMKHYRELEECYKEFFPGLERHAQQQYNLIYKED